MDYLVSGLEMAEMDRQTIEELGVPGRALMEVAGRAVADECAKHAAPGAQIVVACGTGNNGGDGFVAAQALACRGYRVSAFVFGERDGLKPDAGSALKPVEKLGLTPVTWVDDAKGLLVFSDAVAGADLVVDAFFGTGLHSEVRGFIGEAIGVITDSRRPVIAVDIPSGVDADTGAVLGRAISATATVTFGFAKRGHYLFPGAERRGELVVADIGIPKVLAERLGVVGRLLTAGDGPGLMPVRQPSAHKGTFGQVVVVAGSPATPGAALLALGAALRAGAGLVSWAVDEETLSHAAGWPPEALLRVRGNETPEAWAERILEGASALVIGPGFSTSPNRFADLEALLREAAVPVCLDADALNLIGAHPELWDLLRAPAVVTPHPKEMARLVGTSVADIQRDRFASAVQLAMRRSVVVVLKGAGSVVADPDGTVAVIGAGNPGLATGGTGDVLAGIIGALLAQGVDASQAARCGTLLHAVAGDEAAKVHGEAGLRAGDVIESLGGVLAAWGR